MLENKLQHGGDEAIQRRWSIVWALAMTRSKCKYMEGSSLSLILESTLI